MDRLEKIKEIMKKGIGDDDMLYGLLEVMDEEWLISEIERLRKALITIADTPFNAHISEVQDIACEAVQEK